MALLDALDEHIDRSGDVPRVYPRPGESRGWNILATW